MFILSLTFLIFLINGFLATDERVLNGQVAKPHQFPYIVAIFVRFPGPVLKPNFICGGSIINENWVLTAAQCIPNRNFFMTVKAGIQNINIEEADGQVRDVITVVTHPDYEPPLTSQYVVANDIAVLKVKPSFIFNDYVAPAILPNYGFPNVTSGILAGWGSTSYKPNPTYSNQLHYSNLPIIDINTCTDAINEGSTDINFLVQITDNQTCSGPVGENFGACNLDRGSGLVQSYSSKRYEMIGIVSWNNRPCGSGGMPTVYTRVSAYRNWIDKAIMIE